MQSNFQDFVARLAQGLAPGVAPSPARLNAIATDLLALCESVPFDEFQYPSAGTGEERLHPLAIGADGGPSAYLVSDGIGVTSAPHEHQTWAVIVGLRGVERNIYYRLLPGGERRVIEQGAVDVGAGEVLCMQADDIHATEVVGNQPTYHVHLYGRALSALPAFGQRCFVAQAPALLSQGI